MRATEDFQMESSPNDPPSPGEAEQDALRVQTASVAAQQMALLLEEDKLRQRGAALERQEAQLAAHLEERRARLLDLQEQVRQDREALKTERSLAEAERKELLNGLLKERHDAAAATQLAQQERRRLVALRKRLWQRWRRQCKAREANLSRAEQALASEREKVAVESENLKQDKSKLLQTQERINGEVELGRRLLQQGWEELSLTQQEWDLCLNNELTLHHRRTAELDAREATLTAAERAVAEREILWERKQAALTLEVDGLEKRVINLRVKLPPPEMANDSTWLVSNSAVDSIQRAVSGPAVPEAIERIVLDLVDQRRRLLEQWERLLAVQAAWKIERSALLADLETTAAKIDERERTLNGRASDLSAEGEALCSAREAMERERENLDGWRTRLAVRESSFERERHTLATELRNREETLAGENARLQELRVRWGERRRQEIIEMRELRARCEETRSSYLKLAHEHQERRARLSREEREIAARALAYERMRQELMSRAPDAAAAERRLAKLEQRNLARIEARERELSKAENSLRAEIARLDAEWKHLQTVEGELILRQEAFDRVREEWAQSTSRADSENCNRQAEIRQLHISHDRDARELAALREELERIARNLIGDQVDVHLPEERRAA
jgi:hypothetical protein